MSVAPFPQCIFVTSSSQVCRLLQASDGCLSREDKLIYVQLMCIEYMQSGQNSGQLPCGQPLTLQILKDMDFREVAEEATARANLRECLQAVERARIVAAEFESWNEELLTHALQGDVENAGHRGRIVACLLQMKADAV